MWHLYIVEYHLSVIKDEITKNQHKLMKLDKIYQVSWLRLRQASATYEDIFGFLFKLVDKKIEMRH